MDNKTRFGELSNAYDSSRKGYPKECMDYIKSLMPEKSLILDLGCGTGISSRQLVEAGFEVIGVDSDERMLEKAKNNNRQKIRYQKAIASNLPFINQKFSAVMAFGAFHWFRDAKSVSEIKRVLKKGGIFIVVNKRDNNTFRKTYRKVINDLVKLGVGAKVGYRPEEILKTNGFKDVKSKIFPIVETFSLEEAIVHVKSRGTWNHLKKEQHLEATKKLRESFSRLVVNNKIQQKIDVAMFYGRK